MKERLDLFYLTNRQTFFKGWVEMINVKEGTILIDRGVHPSFPKGGKLPRGIVLVPYIYREDNHDRKI